MEIVLGQRPSSEKTSILPWSVRMTATAGSQIKRSGAVGEYFPSTQVKAVAMLEA